MATTFKNARLLLTASYQTAYTCPAGATAIILSCQLANVDGTNAASASVQWLDSSNSNAATRLLELADIAAHYAVDAISKKIVLEAGDALQAKAAATDDVELTVSVVELS
jgi:hypothetical protein